MTRALAITDLDSKHADFVRHLFELGGRPEHAPEAAKRAGFATSDDDAKRSAAILLGSDRITRAIKHEVSQRFIAATGLALRTIMDIAANGRNEAARLAAAREILGQAGLVIVSRSASVSATLSIEEILEQLDLEKSQRATDTPVDVAVREIHDPVR